MISSVQELAAATKLPRLLCGILLYDFTDNAKRCRWKGIVALPYWLLALQQWEIKGILFS
jgi:hypothetical protein